MKKVYLTTYENYKDAESKVIKDTKFYSEIVEIESIRGYLEEYTHRKFVEYMNKGFKMYRLDKGFGFVYDDQKTNTIATIKFFMSENANFLRELSENNLI